MQIYEEIDYIINLDIIGRKNRKLYREARKDEPLCYKAANLILKNVEKGSNVIIATGFILPEGVETDGLNGAVAMARCFNEIGAKAYIVAENRVTKILKKMDAKLNFIYIDEIEEKIDEATMAIAIERPGMGKDGCCHDMHGNVIDAANLDFIFENVASIGIGDGGNEIGMGKIFHAIPEEIASITKADEIVVAGVSNWGAYGIIASLSIMLGKNYCHNGKEEAKLIKKCVDAGAIDGITRKKEYGVDGLPSKVHESIADLLYNIVEFSISI
ncbi:MAG: DUF4392 domain-containing protein [Thermoplasmata archaeon]|nr:DUF4392 domain-containing protein [Thermoplasmata archaeon]